MKKKTQPYKIYINSYLALCEKTIQRPWNCRAASARQCHRELFLFNFLFGSSLYVGHNDLKEQALTRQNQTSQNKAIVAGGGLFLKQDPKLALKDCSIPCVSLCWGSCSQDGQSCSLWALLGWLLLEVQEGHGAAS